MKKYKSLGKAVELTVNSKEENSEDLCLDFVQEFGLWFARNFPHKRIRNVTFNFYILFL